MTGTDRPVIAIVEDQKAIAEMLDEILAAHGYAPTLLDPPYQPGDIAATGASVLLLDIMLDQASGWDILDWLRADDATRDLPTIITSAVYDRPGLHPLPPGGPVMFIPKPFEMLHLLGTLRDLTGHA